VNLDFGHVQQREEHWAIVDLKGKGGNTRTIPMPDWVKALVDDWIQAANPTAGKVFRRVNKNGKAWGDTLTEKAVWHVVREYARKAGIERLAPHDLRRTCARLCHAAGGELDQIQSLLGHVSSNDGAIPWLQAANPIRRERPDRHRTRAMSCPALRPCS
jgi:integrase